MNNSFSMVIFTSEIMNRILGIQNSS
jgi:hypothetical protein